MASSSGASSFPQPSARSGPSREDWERQRPLIKQLYMYEGRTLKDVIAIVSQSGHKATPKMYKDRIAKWGLDKKNKERDMLAICRKKNERDAVGKQSSFRVRGRTVTLEDVHLYLKRRKKAKEMAISAVSTPSDVSCWTPLRANTPRVVEDDDQIDCAMFDSSEIVSGFQPSKATDPLQLSHAMVVRGWTSMSPSVDNEQNAWTDEDCRRLLSEHETVPRSPLPPQALNLLGRLFRDIKVYIHGSIDSGKWITAADGFLEAAGGLNNKSFISPYVFLNQFAIAVGFLRDGSPVEFRRALSQALKNLHRALLEEHPNTVSCVIYALHGFASYGFYDVASFLCRYVSNVATNFLPHDSPRRDIWRAIGRFDAVSFMESLAQLMTITSDMFVSLLGTWHRSATLSYLSMIYELHGTTDLLRHEMLLQGLLAQLERLSIDISWQTKIVMLYLGDNLLQQGRYVESEQVGLEILRHCEQRVSDDVLPEAAGLRLVARSHYCLQRIHSAEKNLRNAIDLFVEAIGSADPYVIYCMEDLAPWLREWGRAGEADQVDAEILGLIGRDEIDEEIEAGRIVL